MRSDTNLPQDEAFGRTPTTEKSNGRDQSPYGFSICLAGGVKGGHQTLLIGNCIIEPAIVH